MKEETRELYKFLNDKDWDVKTCMSVLTIMLVNIGKQAKFTSKEMKTVYNNAVNSIYKEK